MATTQEIAASAQGAGLRAHKNGDLVTAEKLYRRCLAFGEKPIPEVFANYGALLRELQKPKKPFRYIEEALKNTPSITC